MYVCVWLFEYVEYYICIFKLDDDEVEVCMRAFPLRQI